MVLSFFLNIDFYVNLNERYTVFHIKSVCHSLTVHVCVSFSACVCVCSPSLLFFLFLRCIKNARQTQTQEKAAERNFRDFFFFFFFVLQKVQQSLPPHLLTLFVTGKQMEFKYSQRWKQHPKNITNQKQKQILEK